MAQRRIETVFQRLLSPHFTLVPAFLYSIYLPFSDQGASLSLDGLVCSLSAVPVWAGFRQFAVGVLDGEKKPPRPHCNGPGGGPRCLFYCSQYSYGAP